MDQTFAHVPLSRIREKPGFNPREAVGDVAELAEGIKANGLINPLTLCPAEGDAGEYWLVAGARRLAALRLAGRDEALCVVRRDLAIDSAEALAVATAENEDGAGGRKGLEPMEQARAYRRLCDMARAAIAAEKGTSADDVLDHAVYRRVAKLLGRGGKSRDAGAQTIRLALRLLDAPTPIQDMLARGEISKAAALPLMEQGVPADVRERVAAGVKPGTTEDDVRRAVRDATREASAAARAKDAAPGSARDEDGDLVPPSPADEHVLPDKPTTASVFRAKREVRDMIRAKAVELADNPVTGEYTEADVVAGELAALLWVAGDIDVIDATSKQFKAAFQALCADLDIKPLAKRAARG